VHIQNSAAFSVLPARLALSRNARVHIQAHTHAPSCARSRRGICLRAQQEGGGDAPEGSLVDKVAAKGLWQGGVYMLHASFISSLDSFVDSRWACRMKWLRVCAWLGVRILCRCKYLRAHCIYEFIVIGCVVCFGVCSSVKVRVCAKEKV